MTSKKSFVKNVLKKKNFSEIINYVSHIFPKKKLFICKNDVLTYQEFNIKLNQACFFFEKLKIKKGQVISLYFQNSLEFIILYFSIIRYGCIVSPIPYGITKDKIKYYLNLSKSKIFISDINFNFTKVLNLKFESYKNFNDEISKFSSNYYYSNILPKNVCVYYFSSGTTANPKLIKYSNSAMVNCQKILFNSNFLDPYSKHICVLPLGHTASLRYSIKNSIVGAGTVYIFKNFWEIKDKFWNILERKRINFVGTVPSIIETIFYLYKKRKKKLRDLKFIGCGSSILKEELQKNFKKKFKVEINNIYGMSEIGVATMDNPKFNKIYGTIGKELDGVKVKLFDEKKRIINKENIVGEICVKTPAFFDGYIEWKKNNKNKNFIGSYFKTGDLAQYTNGNLKFFDRSKDIIIKGGVNISPQEVDECLQKNKFVYESATIGIYDRFFGENIKSFVVLKKNRKLSEQKLYKFCVKNLGEFRSPTQIEFTQSLPKTHSGKILKRNLKV